MACAEFYQQINPDSILLLSMAACFQGLAETKTKQNKTKTQLVGTHRF